MEACFLTISVIYFKVISFVVNVLLLLTMVIEKLKGGGEGEVTKRKEKKGASKLVLLSLKRHFGFAR